MTLFRITLVLFTFTVFTCSNFTNIENDDNDESFCSWMDISDLDVYVNNKINYGYYVLIVEGRIYDKKNQFRVYVAKNPNYEFYWYWWYYQTLENFNKLCDYYAKDSVDLITSQSFRDINGIERYQATWRKIVYK